MAAGKPRLLFVTRNLPPLRGGMERLNAHLLQELATAFEVAVCCPAECRPVLPQDIDVRTAPLRPLSRFLLGSAASAVMLARHLRPQLVLAGSGLTVPLVRMAAAVSGARSGAYLHGLDIVVNHRVYRRLWVPQFRALDLVLVNSRHTAGLAVRAGVSAQRLNIVHPGVEMPDWDPTKAAEFRQRFGLGDRPLLLSVGRLTARKGLAEFIEAVMPGLVAAVPGLVLAVIGGEASNSLKSDGAGQLQRIRHTIERLALQNQVKLLGEQDDATVCGALFASTALVFPVLDIPGDIEGFGMVAVEAAAHGVRTIAFAVGGVVDAIDDPVSGSLVPAGDYAAMKDKLIQLLVAGGPAAQARQESRDFAAGFRWELFGERVRSVCMGVVTG